MKAMKKPGNLPGFLTAQNFNQRLKFLVELARRAGYINPARNAALAVFYALDNACRLAALRTVG